jgi:hypothetical protein
MRSVRSVALAALAFTVLGASVASAQRRPAQRSGAEGTWELGTDAALTFGLDDQGTVLSIPVGTVRAGYFIRPEWSIEPFLSFDYLSTDAGSGSIYQFGVGGLYHLSTMRTQSQLYLRPFAGLVGFSDNPDGGGGNSESDFVLGGGFGIKWPKLGGRLALRGEVNISHQLAEPEGMSAVGFDFGISFFTR